MTKIRFSIKHKICLSIILLLFLSSCSANISNETSEATSAADINNETSEVNDIAVNAADSTTPISGLEWKLYKFPLLASVPEKELLLYGFWPQGVVLYEGDNGQFFDWDFSRSGRYPPKIFTGDFDNDGVEDIAITIHVGSGTGVSVEELHLLRFMEDDYLPRYNEYTVDADELETLLHEKIKSSFNDNKITLTCDGMDFVFDVSDYVSYIKESFSLLDICYTNYISYEKENEKITVTFVAFFRLKELEPPFSFANVTTDIVFSDSGIELENIKISQNENQ